MGKEEQPVYSGSGPAPSVCHFPKEGDENWGEFSAWMLTGHLPRQRTDA